MLKNDATSARLHAAWLAARAVWPGVELGAAAFERHVRARLPDPDTEDALAGLDLDDLYLAGACTSGNPSALEAFERTLLVHVPRFVARLDRTGTLVDDVLQVLRERLFVASAGRVPSIAGYQGRGTLLAWLRVSAIHTAFRLRRERDALGEIELDEAGHCDPIPGVELELVKAQHRPAFERAVRDALRGLPRRERNLMRLHLVSGISTHRLAAMFHVGQTTIVRSLSNARQAVREAVEAQLRDQLGLGDGELASLARMWMSRIELSLNGCLRSDSAG